MKGENKTVVVLDEVYAERESQDAKWGEQNHPYVAPESPLAEAADHEHYAFLADHWKAENDRRASAGTLAFDGILLEEVYEALAEIDPHKQREELIQVAAVAVAIVEAIDRKEGVAA